jgi:hypothetical protein
VLEVGFVGLVEMRVKARYMLSCMYFSSNKFKTDCRQGKETWM